MLAVAVWSAPALADGDVSQAELATARALFEEGVTREDAKDWAGALERFKRVAEIRVTPQVNYNMARCYEQLGKTMTADVYYARVEKGNAPDLAKLATKSRAGLAAKIPSVVLRGPADLTFTLDGNAATLGTPIPLDPGKHELVSHRGVESATKSFDLTTGKLEVALPDPPPPAPPTPPALPPPPPEKPSLVPPIIAGAVTVVGAGVGIFALVSRSSKESDLDKVCGTARDHCPDSARSDVDKVHTMTTLANIGFGVAIAGALATIGILVYDATKSPSVSASASDFVLHF